MGAPGRILARAQSEAINDRVRRSVKFLRKALAVTESMVEGEKDVYAS